MWGLKGDLPLGVACLAVRNDRALADCFSGSGSCKTGQRLARQLSLRTWSPSLLRRSLLVRFCNELAVTAMGPEKIFIF